LAATIYKSGNGRCLVCNGQTPAVKSLSPRPGPPAQSVRELSTPAAAPAVLRRGGCARTSATAYYGGRTRAASRRRRRACTWGSGPSSTTISRRKPGIPWPRARPAGPSPGRSVSTTAPSAGWPGSRAASVPPIARVAKGRVPSLIVPTRESARDVVTVSDPEGLMRGPPMQWCTERKSAKHAAPVRPPQPTVVALIRGGFDVDPCVGGTGCTRR
jgi:hypothetical protein